MKMRFTIHTGSLIRLLVMPLALLAAVAWGLSSAAAYEVWITDQSDTGKESGGFLYNYNGGKVAAKTSGTESSLALYLARGVGKVCEVATQQPGPRPPMPLCSTG